jgi:hypothetical protein
MERPGAADVMPRSNRVMGGTTVSWVLHLRGSESDAARAIAVAPDGAILIAGQFDGEIPIGSDLLEAEGASDAFLARLSPLGEPLWAARIGGPGFDAATGVAVDRAGNAIVVGELTGSATVDGGRLDAHGRDDLYAVSFTPDGRRRWSMTWGGPGWETVDGVAAAPDGGVIVAGSREVISGLDDRAGDGQADGFLTRIGPGGRRDWTFRLGGDDWDQAHAVAVAHDGTIAVAGHFTGRMSVGGTELVSAGGTDAFAATFSPGGEPRWAGRLGGPRDDAATAVAVRPDGSVAVAGRFAGVMTVDTTMLTSAGSADLFVALLDAMGHPRWAVRQGGAEFDSAQALTVLGDGSLLVAGAAGGATTQGAPADGPIQVLLARYTAAGESTTAFPLTGSFVSASALATTGPHSAVLAGWFIRDVRVAGQALKSLGNDDALIVALDM